MTMPAGAPALELHVVTGTSRGIGEALACALLARADARVVCLARARSDAVDAAARASGARCVQVPADLATLPDLGAVAMLTGIAAVLGEDGPARVVLATLTNNAGAVEPVGMAEHLDPAAIGRAVALNVAAPIALSSAFLALVRDWPVAARAGAVRVLHVSSGAGRRPIPGWATYCATKAALDHHALTLDAEERARDGTPTRSSGVAMHGARVMSIAPGVIDTAMQATIRAHAPEQLPSVERFRALKAEGALASPAEVGARLAARLHAPEFGRPVIADLRED